MGLFGPRPPAKHYTQQGLSREIGDNFSYRRATDYEKEVNPKLPGSWDKGFVPSRREITKRIVDRHANIGGQLVAAPATLGGIGAGYFIGGALGGKRYAHIGRMAGGLVGGLASGIVGAGVGHKLGTRRGKRIAKEIPTEPGKVTDFKSKHPILSRVYFAKRKDLKQHRAIPYNQDYRAKDITVYNDSYGPSVNVGASYPIRKQASIKTGLVKQGYYREDTEMTREELIEGIVESLLTEGKWRRFATHYASPATAIAGSPGMAISYIVGRQPVYDLDTAKDPVAAGKEYSRVAPAGAKFVLPKNKREMKKLAKRNTMGHVGHGLLRTAALGPWNAARYATKVSYARSGYHRGEK